MVHFRDYEITTAQKYVKVVLTNSGRNILLVFEISLVLEKELS
jgi:hypothetical protein